MRFWRLSADPAHPGDVIAMYSQDAVAWNNLGTTAGMIAVPGQVFVSVGAGDDNEALDTAVFSHLNVCP
jgi:hypothetical protein